MKPAKIICGLVCLLLFASQVWSMSRWNEARGVYDDICYLRQAHLFQRFGLGGFDTDISRDDDRYLADRLKEIGVAEKDSTPCHTPMPAANRLVIQYPPGTGMVMALFPQGHQVIPLFVSATTIVLGFALLGIFSAASLPAVVRAATLGCLALYIMINPVKASYSMAPTMAICALAGFLTAAWARATTRGLRFGLVLLLGLVLGCAVNFRLPNLFLASGHALFLLGAFLSRRTLAAFLDGIGFGLAFLVGMLPTFVANAINAGSPFATTYGGQDATPPDFSFAVVWQYVADLQFVLLLLAGASIAGLLAMRSGTATRTVATVTAVNLAVNLAFFFSHPLFTPYYTIPVSMLSLWSLSFASLALPLAAAERGLVGRAANARS